MNDSLATSPLADCVADFGNKRVLVIGDAILDEYVFGDCSRISPEAPVPVLLVQRTNRVLGGAANTAANVVSLGGQARLISIIGDDEAGQEIRQSAKALGIEVVSISDGRPTPRKTRVVGQHQQVVRLDYEDIGPIDTATEAAAISEYLASAAWCDIVVISDYAKGLLTSRICRTVIQHARERGAAVVIDPRPQHRIYYEGCTYLTPNWREARAMLALPDAQPEADEVAHVSRLLASELNTNVLLTLGPHGMYFCSRDHRECFELQTFAKEVFDVSGAGDTVVAAFALALAAGGDHVTASAIANRAAGVAVGKFGTASVGPEELFHDDDRPRLLSREAVRGLGVTLRAKGKRIATINGSFDVLHGGHLHILEQARKQGDVLVVGLNSDRSVAVYKGPGRPIMPQLRRAQILLALRAVDYVHIFDEDNPIAFLEAIQPHVHVNGSEYGHDCIEAATVKSYGGTIHIVERLPGLSSSHVIDTIRADMPLAASPSLTQ